MAAICEDLILRSVWTLSFSIGIMELLPHQEFVVTGLAILEVFRLLLFMFSFDFVSNLLLPGVLCGTFSDWKLSI